MALSSIPDAIESIQNGGFVIVVDHEDRENEGDLICAAQTITTEQINFMIKHARGLICVPMTPERLDELELPLMISGQSDERCKFAMSVDARHGATTGISAADRAQTIRVLCDPQTKPDDLIRPGHMFPLRYKDGGVLARPGHTEASVDLARLAGLYPAGVICEIINDDGSMAKLSDLVSFGKMHGVPIITIDDLIAYRKEHDEEVPPLTTT